MNHKLEPATNTSPSTNPEKSFWKRIHWSAWSLFALALTLLIVDHWVHVLGVLPYLVLLACPLAHFFMHGKHGHRHHRHNKTAP